MSKKSKKWKRKFENAMRIVESQGLSTTELDQFQAHVERTLAVSKDHSLSDVAYVVLFDVRRCAEFAHASASDLILVYDRVSKGNVASGEKGDTRDY